MKRLISILSLVAAISSAAPVGVTVNGVDASALSGVGWAYDPATSNLVLSAAGPYVVSSAGAEGRVQVVAQAENGQRQDITLSNLVLTAQCPFALGEGAKAVIALDGTNALTATKSGQPAILVPRGAALTITNAPAADDVTNRPYLAATGASYAPSIGGARYGAVGTLAITGGEIVALGGVYGAGIGAGQGGFGGSIEIAGGLVDAQVASSGAGIGGGNGGHGPSVSISGGTVVAHGLGTVDIGPSAGSASTTSTQTVTIVGGSVHAYAGRINPAPTNGAARVWCVAVAGLAPGESIELALSEVSGLAPGAQGEYGTEGIVADQEGKIYLWLPDGEYELTIGETRYAATVDGANTEATPIVPPPPPLGVAVNGVDACEGAGKGWSYDSATSNLTLSAVGPYVISGTNTEGAVQILCSAVAGRGTTKVTLSNLVLTAQCPFALAEGAKSAIALAGTNALAASEAGLPAIFVPEGAAVEIAANDPLGLPFLAAAGGNGAPAIGGDGALAISGGRISATGDGAALAPGSLSIAGGTVEAADVAASGSSVTITGGSLNTASADVSPAPSNGTVRVWRVTVAGLAPGQDVGLVPGAQDKGYGTAGIVADDEGKIYLWLPDGEHELAIGEAQYAATVDGADTEATPVEPTPPQPQLPLGVTVNGVDAVEGSGTGWSFDGGTLTLDGAGPFVISGTNTEGAVQVVARAENGQTQDITLSNLVLTAQCPFALETGAGATLALAGTNLLEATKSGQPAILVPGGASLTITNAPAADGLSRPYLEATGAGYAPAIGGTRYGAVGTILIAGGEIVARGGSYGAGIGAGQGGSGGLVMITGGLVDANGGSAGAGIGGGNNGHGTALSISGGTVVAHGLGTADIGPSAGSASATSAQTVTIVGGSVHAYAGRINPAPTNGAARVWCVTVTGLVPGEAVELNVENAGLAPGTLDKEYGTNGIVADEEGKIYLWLPDGEYAISAATGDNWTATVAGKNVVATYYSAKPDAIHIDSIAVGGDAVTIVATVTPASWLEGHADALRVRAGATLPLPDGDEALLDASEVETTVNGGTATLVFPAPARPASFFRIDVP